jgi:hypothetical protein
MSLEVAAVADRTVHTPGRFRKDRPGPESTMVCEALYGGLPFKWADDGVFLREPELPSGAPDVLLLRFSGNSQERYLNLSELELKMLHFLTRYPVAGINEIATLLCWQVKVVKKILDLLSGAGLVVETDGFVKTTSEAKSFLAKDIIAIEAKVGGWRRAILQAHRNQWFASQSYVLLSTKTISEEAKECAARCGVGILKFDGCGTKIVVRSKKDKLPGSYASWLVSMWGRQQAITA